MKACSSDLSPLRITADLPQSITPLLHGQIKFKPFLRRIYIRRLLRLFKGYLYFIRRKGTQDGWLCFWLKIFSSSLVWLVCVCVCVCDCKTQWERVVGETLSERLCLVFICSQVSVHNQNGFSFAVVSQYTISCTETQWTTQIQRKHRYKVGGSRKEMESELHE